MSALTIKLCLLSICLFPGLPIGQEPTVEWGQAMLDDHQMMVYDRDASAIVVVLVDCGHLTINDGNGTRETS